MSDFDVLVRKAIDQEVSVRIADALKTLSIIAAPDGKTLQAVVLGTKHEIKGALPRAEDITTSNWCACQNWRES